MLPDEVVSRTPFFWAWACYAVVFGLVVAGIHYAGGWFFGFLFDAGVSADVSTLLFKTSDSLLSTLFSFLIFRWAARKYLVPRPALAGDVKEGRRGDRVPHPPLFRRPADENANAEVANR